MRLINWQPIKRAVWAQTLKNLSTLQFSVHSFTSGNQLTLQRESHPIHLLSIRISVRLWVAGALNTLGSRHIAPQFSLSTRPSTISSIRRNYPPPTHQTTTKCLTKASISLLRQARLPLESHGSMSHILFDLQSLIRL